MKAAIGTIALSALGVTAQHKLAAGLEAMLSNITSSRPGMRRLNPEHYEDYFVGSGCWCNFDEFGDLSSTGMARPVDEWDENCKTLRENYECIMMDMEAESVECIPWTEVYKPVAVADVDSIADACFQVAGGHGYLNIPMLFGDYHGARQTEYNKCVELSCIVESHYIHHVARILLEDAEVGTTNFNEQYLHSNPEFNRRDACVIQQGINDPERECCGEFPARAPFKPFGGNRECCADFTVKTAGTC